MSEKEYLDADYEVISMCNRKRGPGGQLPGRVVHFVPEERAERVLELDRRMEKLQRVMPIVGPVVIAAVSLLIGRTL